MRLLFIGIPKFFKWVWPNGPANFMGAVQEIKRN